MERELFTHPVTPSEDGWATFNETEEVEVSFDVEAIVADVERELVSVFGSVPPAFFRAEMN